MVKRIFFSTTKILIPMTKIIYYLSIAILTLLACTATAQNEINVSVTDAICQSDSGSITLSLAYPASPQFPLPYTIGVEALSSGRETYFEMTSASMNIEGLRGISYLVTIYFNETCKLDIPVTILGNDDIISTEVTYPCGTSSGKLALLLDDSNFKPSWHFPFTALLKNTKNNQVIPFIITNPKMELNNLNAGEYELSLVLNHSCTLTQKIDMPHQPFAQIELNGIQGYFPTCKNAANGQLSINVKDSLSFININSSCTFLWSNGSTKRSIPSLAVGQYCVTATSIAAPQCKTSKCFEVQEFDVTLSAETYSPTSCPIPNGYIKVKTSNNKFPYSYSWSNGATNNELTGLAGGQYCVTVSFGLCKEIQCYQLTPLCCPNTNNLSITAIVTNGVEGGPNSPTGKMEVTVSGGSGDYTYTWFKFNSSQNYDLLPGLSGPEQIELASGTYLVEVKDKINGCRTHIFESIKNLVCKNSLDNFWLELSDFLVPLVIPKSDKFNYCDVNFGRRIYVAWADLTNGNQTRLPLKIECIPPPGVKNVPDSIRYITTKAQLNAMIGTKASTFYFMPAYRVLGAYHVKLTDACGYTKTLEINTCLPCQPPLYDDSDDDKHYVGIQYSGTNVKSNLYLEINKPCIEGSTSIFYTANTIKLKGTCQFGFHFKITWPNGDTCTISRSLNDKVKKTGNFKFTVTQSQYNAKVPLIVTVTRKDGCTTNIPILFNGGTDNLMPLNGTQMAEYTAISTCRECSTLTGMPSEYITNHACPNGGGKMIKYWDYRPNDVNDICGGGGSFISDIIVNGAILSDRRVEVFSGLPHEEVDYRYQEVDAYLYCRKGKGCLFNSKDIFGVGFPHKIYLDYCNLYDDPVGIGTGPSGSPECPKLELEVDENKNIIVHLVSNYTNTGSLTVTSPFGTEYFDNVSYYPPGSTYVYNTGGKLGNFTFSFDPLSPSNCGPITKSIKNTEDSCPVLFEITNFMPSANTASVLFSSGLSMSGRIKINEKGQSSNLVNIDISILKGINLIDFPTQALKLGKTYILTLEFDGSCAAITKELTIEPSDNYCPKIEDKSGTILVNLRISSEQEILNKYNILIINSKKEIVKSFPLKIEEGINTVEVSMAGLPAGSYTIKVINKIGCPPLIFTFSKSNIIDPNPGDNCIENKSVDIYFDKYKNEFIHTTGEIFENSINYSVASISDSTYKTITEYIRLNYDSLIVKYIRITNDNEFIVVGVRSNTTYVLLVTPSRQIKWERYFIDFIVSEVSYALSPDFPLHLYGTSTISNIKSQILVNNIGTVISTGPIEYYDVRGGGSHFADNVFLHKNNIISSFYKDVNTTVTVYNTSTKLTNTLVLDPIVTVKKIFRMESGEYFIAGSIKGIGKIGDSLEYDLSYTSGILIWTDTLLQIKTTKVFDINEDIVFKNIATNFIDKFLLVYTTSDTIYNVSNESMRIGLCDRIVGFSSSSTFNRSQSQDIDSAEDNIQNTKDDFYAYPNPSKGSFAMKLNAHSNSKASYTITNIEGKILQRENTQISKGLNDIHTGNLLLKSGIYFVKMTLESGELYHAKVMIIE